ncbi:MAG: PAS domain S-box protein [bacterium]|nr:PAS domain S-box protein [bacterium]
MAQWFAVNAPVVPPLARKDGSLLPVETGYGPENGMARLHLGLSKDLTAEQEAQQRFESLFRNNPALMAVSDTKDRKFIDVNDAFLKTIGYTREEVIGRNGDELNLFADPEQQQQAGRQLWETGRIAEIELRIRRKNGEILHGLFTGEMIISQGKQYFLTVMVDITEHRKATEALRESRELLNSVLHSIPARVFWKDRNGIYLGCNELFALDAGLRSPEEIVGKDDHAMVWRDQAELYCADDRAVIESGVAKMLIEEPQTTPTGELIHLLTSKTPLRNSSGEIVGVLGTYLDITDRRSADHALKVRESYCSIIENQPGLVWLKDTESRFLAVNKSFAASCGKAEQQDLVGLTDLDIWPKELAEQYRHDDAEVIRTGQSKIVEELVRDRGEDRWFETFKTPVLDDNGRIIGTTGYARDITERKQAEEALRKSEERYHQLFNSVLEGIVTVDPNYVIEYYNPSFAQVFESVQTDELIGRNLLDLTPEDQHEVVRAQAQNRKMGPQSQYELDIITLNGRRKKLLASVSPRMDDQGNYLGAFGTVIDITEMKRLQQLESRAQRPRQRGRSPDRSHDFNNMLALMMAYPELIRESLPVNDPAFHYLDSIEDSAKDRRSQSTASDVEPTRALQPGSPLPQHGGPAGHSRYG